MSSADSAAPALGGRQARWVPHNDERRERIIAAAIELLDENAPGVEAPMQQIAERAGLAKSVVYRQFSGRDDLDRQVRSAICAEFAATVDAALDIGAGSIRVILVRAVGAVVDWIAEHPRRDEFVRRGPGVGDPANISAMVGLQAEIASRARQLVSGLAGVVGVADEPAIDTMTFAIVTMTESTVNRWTRDPHPALTRTQLVTAVAGYAWSVLDGVAREHQLTLDPDRPLLTVLSDLAAGTPAASAQG
ncbi:TetR/AcrR family transcriptional regulator [Nocardia sp. NBC_01503]|uniref:TetR/AcrR family transcriptional regulator n=1 Tax=Nocardia sp. NBC_01503 TaxID=2975997 RepID=UPI002E7AB26D|nr:TetR/AcrR family transcriptional regulator [Nocardia sp. NBC_01503]WTL31137.1 TetR/AcrR family transcriptional regulator [Nocardia sp. NBC_01503]